jgi:hypothetical protein
MKCLNRFAATGLLLAAGSAAFLYAAESVKESRTENSLNELLQQRLETAKQYATAAAAAYETDTISLPEVINAYKSARDAELALASTPAQRAAAFKYYLDRMGFFEKKIGALYALGLKGGEQQKYLKAKLERQTAEIEAFRAK